MQTCVERFDESSTSVLINDKEDGKTFVCDEEPHILTPERGYGYYPLTLGQQLDEGKIEIVRKLGWAGNSSVWLARAHRYWLERWIAMRMLMNNLSDKYQSRYVSVKVLTVNTTVGVIRGHLHEVDHLRTIAKANPAHPGYKHCLRLYDLFLAVSDHGPHVSLVTNVLGGTIVSLSRQQANGHRTFPVAVTKRIVKQTLLALDYLHRECCLVHTGNSLIHTKL